MKTLTLQLAEVELKFKSKKFGRDYTEGVSGWGFPVGLLQVEDLVIGIDLKLPDSSPNRPSVYLSRLAEVSDLWSKGIGIPKGYKVVKAEGLESFGLYVTECFTLYGGIDFTSAEFSRVWWECVLSTGCPSIMTLAGKLFPANFMSQDTLITEWFKGNCIPKGWKVLNGYFVFDVDIVPDGWLDKELVDYAMKLRVAKTYEPVIEDDEDGDIYIEDEDEDLRSCL